MVRKLQIYLIFCKHHQKAKAEERYWNLISISRKLQNDKKEIWKKNLSFEVFTEDVVANAIKNLPTGKSSVSNDIPVSIMKETIDA